MSTDPLSSIPSQSPPAEDLEAIYIALEHGRGHERVTDANVDALIERARRAGNTTVEVLLREWRSTCGEDPDMPSLPPAVPRRR